MVGSAIDIALSGVLANSQRISNAASNIANVRTTGSLDTVNGPAAFAPNDITQETLPNGGVLASQVPRQPAFVPSFDPGSPFADADGIIAAPNVNLAAEAVDIISARVAFEANIAVLETARELSDDLLSIFDEEA